MVSIPEFVSKTEERMENAAILVSLIEKLKARDSWCGETNIQKAVYFLQTLTGVPLKFDFILYKYGPYSFDLNDELYALEADFILKRATPDPRYGPRILPAEASGYLKSEYGNKIDKYQRQIDFIAAKLGEKDISAMERYATTLYVIREENLQPEHGISRLQEIKPHVSEAQAQEAFTFVSQLIDEVNKKALRTS